MENSQQQFPILLGWREWLGLPNLGINRIKAKIDTGARTSTLHAFKVQRFSENSIDKVRFDMHPIQYSSKQVLQCIADLLDIRWVTDSGGHREQRCVIVTTLSLADLHWPIELTLTNRDDMRFRMLLGRNAMRQHNLVVNPAVSYVLGKRK